MQTHQLAGLSIWERKREKRHLKILEKYFLNTSEFSVKGTL